MPRGVYVRTPEVRARCVELGRQLVARYPNREGYKRWVRLDPERAFAIYSAGGKREMAKVRRCDEPGCGRIIAGPSFFRHQKAKHHNGFTRLDLIDTDNTQGETQ